MNRKLEIIIGSIVFILILGETYLSHFKTENSENNIELKEQIEQEEIIYKGKLPMPVQNFIAVTSKYGARAPIYDANGNLISSGLSHLGIDLCGDLGSKIIAVQDGEITHSGWMNSYGNCVEIKHCDEQGKVFYTFYAHMRDNSLKVIAGQTVTTGQVIGIQGTTGDSTGDHLHFEIRTNQGSNQYAIDPTPYLFKEKGRN